MRDAWLWRCPSGRLVLHVFSRHKRVWYEVPTWYDTRSRHQPGWSCCWPSWNWQWNGRLNLVYEDFIFECKLTLKHARFQRGNNSNNRDNFVARGGVWRYNVSLLFIMDQKGNLEETEGSGGGTDSHMKQTGMLVVSLRGVNLDFGLA